MGDRFLTTQCLVTPVTGPTRSHWDPQSPSTSTTVLYPTRPALPPQVSGHLDFSGRKEAKTRTEESVGVSTSTTLVPHTPSPPLPSSEGTALVPGGRWSEKIKSELGKETGRSEWTTGSQDKTESQGQGDTQVTGMGEHGVTGRSPELSRTPGEQRFE